METLVETKNAAQIDQVYGAIPVQTIDLSKPDIQSTPLFYLQDKSGLIYRSDFQTWSFSTNGRGCTFEFFLGEPQPVDLTATLCAALVGGQANCPISAKINGAVLFQSYNDHDCNWHNKTWTINANQTIAGWNILQFTLDPQARTQLFIQKITVDQAILHPQTIDLSKSTIVNADNLKKVSSSSFYFRSDFSTWSFYDRGVIVFEFDVCEPLNVNMTLVLCSSLSGGTSNCPITATINSIVLLKGFDDHNPNFHPVVVKIDASKVKMGKNQIQISLDPNATTQMFFQKITISGE
jgi:hypothetical protein